ncbi:hypothetical protein GGX14DRAFT_400222 [Mycena pura]|uniref:Uncharacterized protein n=1 Tax=Mycena pura TaxID=153505 RepID=A0AAD6YBM3_9AGAR|nr:hypothetical protein GGX14DRAFT_400222 [Mycena pura]
MSRKASWSLSLRANWLGEEMRYASLLLPYETISAPSISNSRVGTTETLIENIVCGSDSPPSVIKVATSRAPDFGASYRHFNNAFRQLGPLQSFGNDVQPPSSDFNFSLDILALLPSAAASTYLKPWIDMGVSCESHFILFFIFEPSMCSMPNLLCTQQFVHEQEFGVGPEDSISQCHSPSELSSLASSSALSPPLPSDSRRSRSWSPYRVRDPAVMDICAARVPNFDQLKALATFKGGAKATLPSLALTFYSMTQILEGLSLQPDNPNASECFTQAGVPTTLKTRQVIEAFGWSASTFDNKRKLYKNAQKIASKNWKGEVPENADQLKSLYDAYRGIRYLWAKNGPLACPLTMQLPSPNATGDEKLAAELKQAYFAQQYKAIFDHIQ